MVVLFSNHVYAANVYLQSPANGETVTTNQPVFHWHDDDHASKIRRATIQLSRSPQTDNCDPNGGGFFTGEHITAYSDSAAQDINNITEVTVDLKTAQVDNSNQPAVLSPGVWYWHACSGYVYYWPYYHWDRSYWSEVRSLTVLAQPTNSVPPSTGSSVKQKSTISLSARPRVIKKGQKVLLKGRLKAGGKYLKKARIRIMQKTKKWRTAKIIKTNSKGFFVSKLRVKNTCYFKAIYAGSSVYAVSRSRVVRVKVRTAK